MHKCLHPGSKCPLYGCSCIVLHVLFVLAVQKDLSDEEHYHGGAHNAEYDHEAFLGKTEAKTFHDLPPAESKRRLG